MLRGTFVEQMHFLDSFLCCHICYLTYAIYMVYWSGLSRETQPIEYIEIFLNEELVHVNMEVKFPQPAIYKLEAQES